MVNDTKTSRKIKEKIVEFSYGLSKDFKKPCQKFIRQIIFGIQAAKDVKLSNISRALNEDIPLIKTENRLSRHLSKYDFSEAIEESILEKAGCRIGKETVLALDISDIRKEFARKMEYLAKVYDGSTGEKHSPGYWLCSVFGAKVKGEELVPMYQELFSQEAEDFVSENQRILDAVKKVNKTVKQKGIWALDRGGDRGDILRYFLDEKLNFVIRLASLRNILYQDELRNVLEVARRCHLTEEIEVSYNRYGQEEKVKVKIGRRTIKLPLFPGRELTMVIVKGFGKEPMMLLTTLTDKVPEEILEIYLTRWKCEESFRFMKQTYHLEDVRYKKLSGLEKYRLPGVSRFLFC